MDSKVCERLKWLYVTDEKGAEIKYNRICRAKEEFGKLFGAGRETSIFSAPGRIEICGNHTDHQGGRVLAAGINLDVIAVVSKNDDGIIRIKSEGFDMDTVGIDETEKCESEINKSASLIRGIVYSFKKLGFNVGGFDAYTTSEVLKGSGMSSSAAFEVLVGTIISSIYCDDNVSAVEIAKIGQFAENEYFGKPCGLMDQSASSIGNLITIDFADKKNPIIEKLDYDFSKSGHSICIIDTRADHADLTDEYASIPAEMRSVAAYFGKEILSQVDEADFKDNISSVANALKNDRAVLRAYHFFNDTLRVKKQVEALKNNDFDEFKSLISESGRSSFMYLQNIYSSKFISAQPVAVALAACECILNGDGAFRVHGGGFAGTIQAFVPNVRLKEFKAEIEKVTGQGTCHVLSVRQAGGIKIF